MEVGEIFCQIFRAKEAVRYTRNNTNFITYTQDAHTHTLPVAHLLARKRELDLRPQRQCVRILLQLHSLVSYVDIDFGTNIETCFTGSPLIPLPSSFPVSSF